MVNVPLKIVIYPLNQTLWFSINLPEGFMECPNQWMWTNSSPRNLGLPVIVCFFFSKPNMTWWWKLGWWNIGNHDEINESLGWLNMSQSVGMMKFPTEWKNRIDVPKHQMKKTCCWMMSELGFRMGLAMTILGLKLVSSWNGINSSISDSVWQDRKTVHRY